MKEINVTSYNVPASARSKNYKGSLTSVVGANSTTAPTTPTPAGGSADTAKVAQNLAADSTDWAKIMRKDIDDRTENSLSIGKNLGVDGRATISELVATALSAASATIQTLTATALTATSATILGALTAATVSATTLSGGSAAIQNDITVGGGGSFAKGAVFYGQTTPPTGLGTYVLNYVSATYGARITAYDGVNYQKLSLGKLVSGSNFQLELNSDGTSKFNGGVITNGLESSKGGVFFGQYASMPSGFGTYVANYVSDVYGARILAYDGAAYKDLKLGAMPTTGVFSQTLLANGNVNFGYNVGVSGTVTAPTFIGDLNGNAATTTKLKTPRTIWGQNFDGSGNISGDLLGVNNIDMSNSYGYIKFKSPFYFFTGIGNDLSWYNTQQSEHQLYISSAGGIGINTTAPVFKLDVGGNMRVTSDIYADLTIGTRNFASHTIGWNVNAQGAADFRNIYADELRVQAFTADISQALAGSDYLTKSVSKLSANFVVPSVNGSVRIIVDDIEGMPATQCFANGDYIRFRAFNRTSGLTIANVWGTVALDTSFGTNGFSNGTQAYTFTCTATSGAGLTVFRGSEVLDYGTSGSGMISRTTLDAQGSPYEQIATWVSDPSNSANYTVHARLGNLNGIANCNGYGVYTDNGFFTGKITVGDLTKSNHYLDFSNGALTVKGNIYLASGYSAVSTFDMSNGIALAVNNIQIGGRNLLKGTNSDYRDFSSLGSWSIDSNKKLYTNNNNYGVASSVNIDSSVCKQFILSFDANAQSTSYICNSENPNTGINITAQVIVNGHNTMKIVVPSDVSVFRLNFYGTNASSGTCTLYNIQLEKGNKETTYNVAPEDVDASINLRVSKDGVIGAINLTSEAATINATHINLQGAVTITDFDTTVSAKFTHIDGNGVYTGTLTADQVNAVAISANSIATGTLSADRIGALSVTADKIASNAITTDKLNANAVTADKIAANTITATQINASSVSAAIASVISLDAARITSGTISTDRLNAANIVVTGIVAAQNINAQNATFSNMNVTSGTIYNGTIYNLRSPWVNAATDLSSMNTDNSIMNNESGVGYVSYTLDWTTLSSGRNMQLISRGATIIQAPSDKWFYVNGNRIKILYLTNQIAEITGYGSTSSFAGWVIKSIKPLMDTQQYGKPLNILAHGTVTGTSSSASISYRMFNSGLLDGTQYSMSVSRISEGYYRISFPTQWNLSTNYIVMLTGVGEVIFGVEHNHPSKATLISKSNGYFDVWVSDDSTVNDGSFEFQIFNYYDI